MGKQKTYRTMIQKIRRFTIVLKNRNWKWGLPTCYKAKSRKKQKVKCCSVGRERKPVQEKISCDKCRDIVIEMIAENIDGVMCISLIKWKIRQRYSWLIKSGIGREFSSKAFCFIYSKWQYFRLIEERKKMKPLISLIWYTLSTSFIYDYHHFCFYYFVIFLFYK